VSAKPCWKNKKNEMGFASLLAIFNMVLFHTFRKLLFNSAENPPLKILIIRDKNA
jgi:hypothetical protein